MEEYDSAEENTSAQSGSRDSPQLRAGIIRLNVNDFEIIEYELIQGLRVSSKLLYVPSEKQFYVFNCSSKLGKSYVCREKRCNVRVYLTENEECKRFKSNSNSHLHSDKEEEFNELKVLNEIKSKCAEPHSSLGGRKLTVRNIFYQVIRK